MDKRKIFVIATLVVCTLILLLSNHVMKKDIPFSAILGKEYYYLQNNKATDITITFEKEKVFGFGGVNRYFGSYILNPDESLYFRPLASTMMAGPKEKMEAEREYLTLLNEVNKIKITKNKMILFTKDNAKKLEFVLVDNTSNK